MIKNENNPLPKPENSVNDRINLKKSQQAINQRTTKKETTEKSNAPNLKSHPRVPRTKRKDIRWKKRNLMDIQPKPKTRASNKKRSRSLMFKGKPVRVIITEEAEQEYNELNQTVKKEKSEGIQSSEYQTLLNSINQKIDFLKKDPQYGIHIPKNRIPKEYIIKYNVNNLWKINLPKGWRMIYTLRGNEVEIISLILDLFDHKRYTKKFGYKKG